MIAATQCQGEDSKEDLTWNDNHSMRYTFDCRSCHCFCHADCFCCTNMTAEGPPDSGAAGRSPSGLALVADSVRGIGMIAASTCEQAAQENLDFAQSGTKHDGQ